MVGRRLRCRVRAGGRGNRRVRASRPAAPPDPGRARRRMKPRAPLRVGAPLRPVIGRRDRTAARIRGRAPLSLFWQRRQHVRGGGPLPLSHEASWSLNLRLLQKIVLGLRDPAGFEAGAKAPLVPTPSVLAAWRRSAGSEARRKLSRLQARQPRPIGAKPASALFATRSLPLGTLAAAMPAPRRRAALVPLAAMSPK